jgi:mycoredoxin
MAQATPTQITIYSTSWCSDCRRAKRWMDEHGVAYTNVDIEQDEAAAEYVRALNDGNQSVPTIVFPDGSVLVEPSNTALAAQVEKTASGTR